MTKEEAVEVIYEDQRRVLCRPGDRDIVLATLAKGRSVPFYWDTFYVVPRGVLSDLEEWDAFEEGQRRAISEIVGYPVRLEVDGIIGNGKAAWVVHPLTEGGGR